jgi:hypothetical protein
LVKEVFKCSFPGCDYSTASRSKIDFHHVTPKELKETKLVIPLCKTHHSLIFHPLVHYGQHSIRTEESLEIVNVFDSTHGKAIKYKRFDGSTFFYLPFDGTSIEDTNG